MKILNFVYHPHAISGRGREARLPSVALRLLYITSVVHRSAFIQ